MDIAIPVAPLGVLTLLGFFAPYAVAALNGALPFVKQAWQKKIVSVAVALVLAAVVVVFYYAITKEPITDWWVFALLAIVIVNASYALVTRDSASAVERAADPNAIVVHENSSTKLEPVVINVYAGTGNATEIASVVGDKLRRDFRGEA